MEVLRAGCDFLREHMPPALIEGFESLQPKAGPAGEGGDDYVEGEGGGGGRPAKHPRVGPEGGAGEFDGEALAADEFDTAVDVEELDS